MSSPRPIGAAAALAVVLALPVPAGAAEPFELDPDGGAPHVAVAENGTGHFVWGVSQSETASGLEEVRYCQVPRGATACAKTQRFEGVDGPSSEGPRVLLHRDGRVIIIAERGTERVALVSSDGGETFSERGELDGLPAGWSDLGFRAELGPGENTVSMLFGGLFQAAPLDGPPPSGYADLGPDFESGLAFIDPLTPIVALWDLDTITFRRYDGSGSYNTSANWTPAKPIGPGDEPDLAGGVSGVYLSYETREGQEIRRYDQSGDSFGPPQIISREGGGETREGDLQQSAGGSLHQTWSGTGDAPLEHRRSLDGGASWLPIETLAVDASSGFYDQHVATSSDGGGFAVWSDGPSDRVRAVPIATNDEVARPEPESCRVQIGIAVAIAREGCFAQSGSIYRAPGDVRINGIDLTGQGQVVIDVKERTLKTSAPVTAKVGNVTLGRQRLDWEIPKGAGEIEEPSGNPAKFDVAKARSEVLGLLVSGWTIPRLVKDETVELPVHLQLPSPLSTLLSDKVTGSITLRASNARSLELANATLDLKGVSIGIAEIERFNLVYTNADPWVLRGSTAILIPVAKTKINTDFGFKDGEFEFAKGNVTFEPPRQLATLVFLKQIRFDTRNRDACKVPAKIEGGVTLTLISEAISRIEGNAFYNFPLSECKQPGVFRIQGKGFLRDLQVADMYAQYVTPGTVTFGGGADVTTSSITAGFRVDGAIDTPTETFFVEGKVSAGTISDAGAPDDPATEANEARPPQREEIVGAGVIVSSIGMRACTEVAGGGFNSGFGFHQRWGEDSAPVPDWPFFEGCEGEAEDFKPAGFKSGSRSSARASQSAGFRVGRGVPFVNLRIDGPGGPQVVVSGPGKRSVRTLAGAPELNGAYAFAVRPEDNVTYVRIFRPQSGRWTVATQPGSTITRVLRADGLPKPKVRVRVKKARGGNWLLAWRLRRLPGQRVRLLERGKGGGLRAIRTVSTRRGKLRFRPRPGLGRRREVIAVVESKGFPRDSLTVARFKAPRELPSRPKWVRLKRGKRALLVRWGRSRRATRYAVNLGLLDGRRVTLVTAKRRLLVSDVPAIDGGSVRVAGIRSDNVAGPVNAVRLRPRPQFSFGKLTRNRKRGTARLVLELPGSGTVRLTQRPTVRGAQVARKDVGAGQVAVPIRARGRAKRKLDRARKGATVRVSVPVRLTYRPRAGEPRTKSKRVQLVRRG